MPSLWQPDSSFSLRRLLPSRTRPLRAWCRTGRTSPRFSLAPSSVNLASLSAEELEERGEICRAQRDYLGAIEAFELAIKKKPSSDLYNKDAISLIMLKRFGEARKVLDRSLKLNPNCAETWNNLAVIFYEQRKYSGAIQRFKKAIELNPDFASFHSSLGTVYMDTKQYREAVVEYRRALELDPDIFESNSPYAVAGKLARPEDRARFDFEMARIFASVGDIDHALKSLRRALEEGYPDVKAVYRDKEFEKLRADERFTALMKEKPVSMPSQ